MSFQRCYAFKILFICLFFIFGLVNGKSHWRPTGKKRVFYKEVTVDPSGHGNFSTIQSAIDSIPSDNLQWTCIKVKSGIYREKINVPSDKPYVILKGEGRKRTQIVWDDHASLAQSPTLTVLADNFKAKSISFRNSYNLPWPNNGNPRVPAVAAMIAGDKCSFYRCGFYGLQDTLWDVQGRHYFKFCSIVGAVDFIFGSGQSIYERCTLLVLGEALDKGCPGYITAQGRNNPDDANGFVFKECNVIGNGLTYLGRPWRDYARVLFYNTTMANIIAPEGWYPWNDAGHENQLTLAEYGCNGQGSNTSQRVWWEKKLDWATVKKLTDITFIDDEGWLGKQPL